MCSYIGGGLIDIGYGFNYKINDTVLEFATSYRDLRVTVNRHLKFHCHVRDFYAEQLDLQVIYYDLL